MLRPDNRYEKITLINSNIAWFEDYPGPTCTTCTMLDSPKARKIIERNFVDFLVNFLDVDGSFLGGNPGSWIVGKNQSIVLPDNCQFMPEWNANKCPPFLEGFAQLRVVNLVNSVAFG